MPSSSSKKVTTKATKTSSKVSRSATKATRSTPTSSKKLTTKPTRRTRSSRPHSDDESSESEIEETDSDEELESDSSPMPSDSTSWINPEIANPTGNICGKCHRRKPKGQNEITQSLRAKHHCTGLCKGDCPIDIRYNKHPDLDPKKQKFKATKEAEDRVFRQDIHNILEHRSTSSGPLKITSVREAAKKANYFTLPSNIGVKSGEIMYNPPTVAAPTAVPTATTSPAAKGAVSLADHDHLISRLIEAQEKIARQLQKVEERRTVLKRALESEFLIDELDELPKTIVLHVLEERKMKKKARLLEAGGTESTTPVTVDSPSSRDTTDTQCHTVTLPSQ